MKIIDCFMFGFGNQVPRTLNNYAFNYVDWESHLRFKCKSLLREKNKLKHDFQ